MNSVKTAWEWSLQIEAKRLIHTAHSIADGFFRVNNFFVEPWKPEGHFSKMTVPFPDLPYHKIPRFWERVKRVDIKNFPLEFDKQLINGVVGLLKGPAFPRKAGPVEEPMMDNVKKTWTKAGGKIVTEIYRIIPDKNGMISRIIIHPTRFGTTCSFSVADSFPAAVEMYLRIDQDIYAITEAILSAITRGEVFRELEGMWSESELLVDWLLVKSSLSPLLKKYQPTSSFIPTVKYTRMKQNALLMKLSEEFYRKLGVPMVDTVFAFENGAPTIQGKPIENLSQRERKILRLLISRGNSVVLADEMADLIFSSDEDFSLQAIAKTIQRLRDKLEQNGVSGSFIQTLRGQGYVLKNCPYSSAPA